MRKPINLFFLAAIIPALFLSACGPDKVAESKLSRIENPNAPASDLEQLVRRNTAFAFDLYQAVRSQPGNLVYSPYSILLAFAIAYGGAAGETARQMAEVLHYNLSPAQFHPAFNALDLALADRPNQAAEVPEKERPPRFRRAPRCRLTIHSSSSSGMCPVGRSCSWEESWTPANDHWEGRKPGSLAYFGCMGSQCRLESRLGLKVALSVRIYSPR